MCIREQGGRNVETRFEGKRRAGFDNRARKGQGKRTRQEDRCHRSHHRDVTLHSQRLTQTSCVNFRGERLELILPEKVGAKVSAS
jgi:hypothetical protein